jgi:NADPH2:quinone reductase
MTQNDALPQTMSAIVISAPGGPEVLTLTQVETPVAGPGEVLIRVAAAGINRPDIAQRLGQYDPPPGASPLPGLEVSGVIAACGEGVTSHHIGDRVMALANGGGYAEYVAVPAGQVLPIPASWSFAQAAALPETFFTVIQGLVMRAGLEPGMSVLVHGASGGIGGAAILISRLLGARPIAVTSSPQKAEYATALGAVAVIDRSEDIAARVMALTDGHGADRIVDVVGGAMTAVNIAASARNGHIVQVSTLDIGKTEVPLRQIMFKVLTLSGSTLRPQSVATKAAIAARFAQLLPAMEAEMPNWPRLTAFPFAKAVEAHRLMETREHIGKLVLLTDFGADRDNFR